MVEVEAALMTADVLTGFVVYTQEHERMHGWARCSLVSRHHEGRMAIMSQNVIRPSTMGTVGEEDSVVNSRVGHLPDDDGLACRSRRARCKQEGEVRYLRHDGELTDSGRVDDNDDFRLLRIDGCGKAMTDELDRRVKLWRRERWKRRA